jgi:hypothetical protein
MPCAPRTWATTRYAGADGEAEPEALGLDDVEVDPGAFAGGGGFDEGS